MKKTIVVTPAVTAVSRTERNKRRATTDADDDEPLVKKSAPAKGKIPPAPVKKTTYVAKSTPTTSAAASRTKSKGKEFFF